MTWHVSVKYSQNTSALYSQGVKVDFLQRGLSYQYHKMCVHQFRLKS